MSGIHDLKNFLDHSHSPYHAAANLAALLDGTQEVPRLTGVPVNLCTRGSSGNNMT